ncbi:MAG: Rieske 2Fe-2S domain-containing protein [Acetobacteraceae bacterium]|nr:Rieske 2Fe-2S domain-containing protein [Acetobacteraceae bacterium]
MLKNFWYLATGAEAVPAGRTRPVRVLGEDILIGRANNGAAFAYADRCPHRLMPMRHGQFDGERLRCYYHGWAFRAADGVCEEIPALADAGSVDCRKFRLKPVPCREVQGNIWLYLGAPPADGAATPPIPTIAGFDGAAPQARAVLRFPCDLDTVAFGFVDPAHPAFVHTSRWWRSGKAKLRLKNKEFEPTGLGFRMKQHELAGGGNPYRLLGRRVRINLDIQLPGTRVEEIAGDRHAAGVLAAATPVDADTTDVHYCVYWSVPWLGALRPLARYWAHDFLRQDQVVAVRLSEAGATGTPALFVGDPDAQIRWWLRLKREYLASEAEGRAFVNPLRAQTLSWRS